VHGAAHEEFVCEVVDELLDWDFYVSTIRNNKYTIRQNTTLLKYNMKYI
jgi:hypothetical protein